MRPRVARAASYRRSRSPAGSGRPSPDRRSLRRQAPAGRPTGRRPSRRPPHPAPRRRWPAGSGAASPRTATPGQRAARRGSRARPGPARQPTRRSPRTTSPRSGMRTPRSPAPRSTHAAGPGDTERRAPPPTPRPATRSPPYPRHGGRRPTRRTDGQAGQRAAPQALGRRPRGQGKMPSRVRALTVRTSGQHPHPPLRPPVPAHQDQAPRRRRSPAIQHDFADALPLSPVQDWLYTHAVLHQLGDPTAAEPLSRRALDRTTPNMRPQSRSELMETFRLRGRLSEAGKLLPDLLDDVHPAKVLTSPELVTYAVVLLDLLGRHEQAGGLLATYRPVMRASAVAWAPLARAAAEAFHHVSVGDEARAASVLRSLLASRRVGTG